MKILLIEDNDDHAALIIAKLTSDSAVVRTSSLEDAIARQDVAEFELILSDLGLPDATGPVVVRRLRECLPDVPLVVLTCMGDEETATTCMAEGAQDYLVKDILFTPYGDQSQLLNRVIKYARQRQEFRMRDLRLVQELQESQKQLEAKNRRLRELCDSAQVFVENVSHDIRTPLTVIKEYGSLIRDGLVGPVSGEQQRLLAIMDDRADDLNTMVDDLLDVNKLEAGITNVWRRESELHQVLEHLLPLLTRKAEVRQVDFKAELAVDLPSVYCDQEKVARIVTNLVVNAIKFCGEPGKVRLRARRDDQAREVCIEVQDNGAGIPEEKRQIIFQRFAQLEPSARQNIKGFGLGLGIAKELVDLNLGSMSLESQEGQGSVFSFTLPYAEPAVVINKYLARMNASDYGETEITYVSARTASENAQALRDLDILLGHCIRKDDLAVRVAPQCWLIALHCITSEVSHYLARVKEQHKELSRNRLAGTLPELEFVVEAALPGDCLRTLPQNKLPANQTAGDVCYA